VTVAEELAALRRQHGATHDIWTVPRALGGGPTWHARRHGDPVGTELHADYPGPLSALIKRANAELDLDAALADLRVEYSKTGWRFGTTWASAGTPGERHLTASLGTVLLTARDAMEMRSKLAQESAPS
jgi:hypothetical protein